MDFPLIYQITLTTVILALLYTLGTKAIDAFDRRTTTKRIETQATREVGDLLYMLTQTLQETGTANQQIFAEVIASLHENTAQMKDRTRESIRRNRRTELTKAEQSKTPITDEQIEYFQEQAKSRMSDAVQSLVQPEEEVLIVGG